MALSDHRTLQPELLPVMDPEEAGAGRQIMDLPLEFMRSGLQVAPNILPYPLALQGIQGETDPLALVGHEMDVQPVRSRVGVTDIPKPGHINRLDVNQS